MAQHLDRAVAAAACPVPLAKPPGRPALAGTRAAEARLEETRLEEAALEENGLEGNRLEEERLAENGLAENRLAEDRLAGTAVASRRASLECTPLPGPFGRVQLQRTIGTTAGQTPRTTWTTRSLGTWLLGICDAPVQTSNAALGRKGPSRRALSRACFARAGSLRSARIGKHTLARAGRRSEACPIFPRVRSGGDGRQSECRERVRGVGNKC